MEILRDEKRLQRLADYLYDLHAGLKSKDQWNEYKDVLETTNAFEVNEVIHEALTKTPDIEKWKVPISRFLRATAKALEHAPMPLYEKNHTVYEVCIQNEKLEAELNMLKDLSMEVHAGTRDLEELQLAIRGLARLRDHYELVQNGLFAKFEEYSPNHACVKLMWALQNDVLAMQKEMRQITDEGEFWRTFGAFYLLSQSLIWREKYILLPVAYRMISGSSAEDEKSSIKESENSNISIDTAVFTSLTGSLNQEQLEAILKLLPIDFSFIGADDRVKFYSDPAHRLFPRAPAVIGRLVQNCHPPKSVSAVEEILRTFKDGSRDHAEFWLETRGTFAHIQYFAVRSESGEYMGTLEVSQDASHVRSLKGEKRLL